MSILQKESQLHLFNSEKRVNKVCETTILCRSSPTTTPKNKKQTQNLHFKHFEKRPDRTIVKVYLWVTNKQQTSALITTRASALIEIRVRVNNNALVLCSQ